MSCCETLNRKDFLEVKLANFRKFIEPHCTTEELKKRFQEFNDLETVMPYLLQVCALAKLGQLEASVDNILANFPAADEAFRAKFKRYIAMFVDVLTS